MGWQIHWLRVLSNKPPIDSKIPKAVVSRLSLYLRELQQLIREGIPTISSTKLGRRLGFTASQIRKDIAYFGQFGYPGIGYKCEELVAEIRSILGTDRTWPVVLVGCGNLGQALLGYRGFSTQGFEVVAAVDVDESLVGNTIEGIQIDRLSRLSEIVREKGVRVAILAVPSEAAESAVEAIVDAGITGILNFAPVTLALPKNIGLVEVDLARELEQLAFSVLQKDES
ncbi:redox-sensing transcriptional repressor Rex [Mariniblastus fucicola]|uniref:Redox-sensing transcriptional repressor Rex n=1 Tax=Mariniblastus fucicola TaxID=980251 RepID=A0A5B9PA46_9BACT|nr:redox-sensing transcriptional repressor Rex [Mariniblastus fucicola]QEG21832.1 Redox-sensing transcriptional repressor Rex [Mariniblastus fucicola]